MKSLYNPKFLFHDPKISKKQYLSLKNYEYYLQGHYKLTHKIYADRIYFIDINTQKVKIILNSYFMIKTNNNDLLGLTTFFHHNWISSMYSSALQRFLTINDTSCDYVLSIIHNCTIYIKNKILSHLKSSYIKNIIRHTFFLDD